MAEISVILFICAGIIFLNQITSERKSLHLIAFGYIILIAAYMVLHNY